MTIERKPSRYAHSDGHTDVCYSEDGRNLITCGTDGDIRIWCGFNDDDPIQTCVGEWSLCVAQKDNQLYVATDNNNVQLMTFPEGERNGIFTRFTAPVNHMAVGKDHNLIAVGPEDMDVKVIDTLDSTITKFFTGLTGPPLSVALSTKAKLLAVSSGDGHLRIWNVEDQMLVKELLCVPKINSFMHAKLLCRIHFDPISGQKLAYPDKNTVIILNTFDWSVEFTLNCSEIDSSYSIVQFSPCSKYIAATTEKGDLIVWQISTKSVLDITKHPRSISICAMVWNPLGNGEIAFCDVEGQLGIATNCVTSTEVDSLVADTASDADFTEFRFEDDDGDDKTAANESDDDDNENAISLEKLKKDIMGPEEPELDFDKASSRSRSPRPRTPELPLQAAFMPTSTPEHLNPRYLCWNEVGVVRSFGNDLTKDDDGMKSIEVEFHDANFHNTMMMQNFQGYTMGSLSTGALVVANTSQVTVVPLSAGTKEWYVTLEENEEINCIASSDRLVCFTTSTYLGRVYSLYGTQKAVFVIPGPVISITSYSHFVLIAYHSASGRKGDQCINMMLVKLEGTSVQNRDLHCALGPESTLRWLGFTDMGTPGMQDSIGMIYLYPLSANIWMPFCDTTKHVKSPIDGIFVTAVCESSKTLRGIRCRGSVYPGFIPRPALAEFPLEPPFAEIATEKSQLEASLFTWSVLQVENTEKKYKETVLKTFALACKNNLDQRAFELVEMIANPQLLTLAMKYVNKLDRRRLAEKLMELASRMQESNSDDETSQNDIAVSAPPKNVVKPLNRKLTMNVSKRISRNASEMGQVPTQSESNENNDNAEVVDSGISQSASNGLKTLNMSESFINSQDLFTESEEVRNPFLKSLQKKNAAVRNPLSLTDKFAGFTEEKEEKRQKENGQATNSEKRKPESDIEKPKGKQRKLDKFMFSKRT